MTELRIVTINTAKGDYSYHRRMTVMAEQLAELEPDLVLLQESLESPDGRFNTAGELGKRLGLKSCYAPARRKYRAVDSEWIETTSGLGILSRRPLLEAEALLLPSDPADGERIALLARLEIDGHRLLLANVHLSHLWERAELRRRQIEATLAHRWFGEPWDLCLVGGDFNTRLPQLDALLVGVQRWNVRDTYVAGGGGAPRATIPADLPAATGHCVDYLFSLATSPEGHPNFADSRVVLGEADATGLYPSDHRGVMTTLRIDTKGNHGE